MSFNRARFIILENKAPIRDADAARALYDPMFVSIGGEYAGWIAHPYGKGPHPAHFYIFENPNPVYLAEIIRKLRAGEVEGKLMRERWSKNGIEYDIDQIMLDISHAMRNNLTAPPVDSEEFAACWEGIKVLEALAQL